MDKKQDNVQSRAADLSKKALRGPYDIFCSRFLSPGEQRVFLDALREASPEVWRRTFLWGGAMDAERRVALCVPEYVDVDSAPAQNPFSAEREEFFVKEVLPLLPKEELPLKVLMITGSPYTPLTHRDYMGSILGLGVSRDVIGDIAVIGECSALVFAADSIVPFIEGSLERIGRDRVKVARHTPEEDFRIPRKYETLVAPVASPRLDCLVASLTGRSRSEAKELVESGLVELSYRVICAPDHPFTEGDVLSVRGHGKFIVDSFGGPTRSGRTRVSVRKYL